MKTRCTIILYLRTIHFLLSPSLIKSYYYYYYYYYCPQNITAQGFARELKIEISSIALYTFGPLINCRVWWPCLCTVGRPVSTHSHNKTRHSFNSHANTLQQIHTHARAREQKYTYVYSIMYTRNDNYIEYDNLFSNSVNIFYSRNILFNQLTLHRITKIQ